MVTPDVVREGMGIDGRKVRQLREAKGWSQDDLASAAGVSQSTVDKIERGITKKSKVIAEIAGALEVEPAAIDPSFAVTIAAVGKIAGSAFLQGIGAVTGFKPPPLLVSETDPLPLHAAAEGGDGTIIINTDPIDTVPRPYTLRGAKEAYAILITGESMVPAFRPGDIAWVDPRLPPIRETEAIFYNMPADGGEVRASIKELVRWTESDWIVRQWNPQKEFKLPRAEWAGCHRVVGRLMRR